MEMEMPPWASSLAAVLATALFLVAVLRRRHRRRARKYNVPPGPRPWPVIGNLNLIGPLPHRSVHELSARYGPLMSLRFGSFPVVVGSSVDAAQFFLRTHDLAFLDRPRMAAGKYTVYNYSGMLWSHYGAYWRQARKLWLTELLSARQLRLTENIRGEEVRAMLRDLRAAAAAGRAVVFKEHLLMVTLNVISRMVLGKKYVVEGPADSASAAATPEEFRWMIEEIFFLNGVLHIGDMVPWLGWLDPQGYIGRMKRLSKMFDRFLEHVLQEHDERRLREGEAFVPNDMVDLLLQLADDRSLEVPIGRDGVKASILELIAGGTDTSAVTVEWAMSELLRKPRVLAKATEELDRVVGRGRLVVEGDIPSLPYLEAVVKETMRLHPVVPLLIPRVAREDTAVDGYDIPAVHARARQRLGHRPRPGGVGGRGRGVPAGAVRRERRGREGAGPGAAAVRGRPPDVPRPRPRAEDGAAGPGEPAARLRLEAPRRRGAGGAEHGGEVRDICVAHGPARGRPGAQAPGSPVLGGVWHSLILAFPPLFRNCEADLPGS